MKGVSEIYKKCVEGYKGVLFVEFPFLPNEALATPESISSGMAIQQAMGKLIVLHPEYAEACKEILSNIVVRGVDVVTQIDHYKKEVFRLERKIAEGEYEVNMEHAKNLKLDSFTLDELLEEIRNRVE